MTKTANTNIGTNTGAKLRRGILLAAATLCAAAPPSAEAIPVIVTNDITPIQLAMDISTSVEEIAAFMQQVQQAMMQVQQFDQIVAQTAGMKTQGYNLIDNIMRDTTAFAGMFKNEFLAVMQGLDKEMDELRDLRKNKWGFGGEIAALKSAGKDVVQNAKNQWDSVEATFGTIVADYGKLGETYQKTFFLKDETGKLRSIADTVSQRSLKIAEASEKVSSGGNTSSQARQQTLNTAQVAANTAETNATLARMAQYLASRNEMQDQENAKTGKVTSVVSAEAAGLDMKAAIEAAKAGAGLHRILNTLETKVKTAIETPDIPEKSISQKK